MPALPPSSPSPPSLSAPAVGLIVFVLSVIVFSGFYLLGLHISDKIVERRARVADVESVESVGAIDKVPQPVVRIGRVTACHTPMICETAVSVAAVAAPMLPHLRRLMKLDKFKGPARFRPRRIRTTPGPSPLRVVICADDLAAAAVLVAARANLPKTLEATRMPKVPAVDVAKVLANVAPRCHLSQLNEYEVPARFDARRSRALPGPSPLRTVAYIAPASAPVAAPAKGAATPSPTRVLSPSRAGNVALAPVPGPTKAKATPSPSRILAPFRAGIKAKQPAAKSKAKVNARFASAPGNKGQSVSRSFGCFTGEKENGTPFRFP
ncbi:hypothetical protein DFH06DRAFT_1130288 [Mycena polygramma]|nr:hypothetical protein DFH06DRAFT_1130288 [Mycena polygramma]